MKTASRTAVIAVLLVSVTGCMHKTNSVPPPQAQAPVAPPSKMAHTPPLPQLPEPNPPSVTVASTEQTSPAPAAPPHRTPRHKPAPAKPVDTATAQSTAPPADKPGTSPPLQAANGGAPDSSPIGQLSSTGDAAGAQGRHDIEQLIATTENGLANIKRTLTPDEQLTSTQIKTFLTKARQALTNNDLDGAETLATKAKVLLDELTKS